MYAALRRLYGFCKLRDLCVCISLLRSKRLVHVNMSFARKEVYVYVYGLCTLSGLCVRILPLCVKRRLRTYTDCVL